MILGLIIGCIRYLPINFGVHTILSMISLGVFIFKIRLGRIMDNSSISGALITMPSLFIMLLLVTSFVFSYFTLYKRCPVVSKNKPLEIEANKKLRKKAFILTIILIITKIALYILYISYYSKLISTVIVCVLLCMLIQVFVLIKPGRALIQRFDNLLRIVI